MMSPSVGVCSGTRKASENGPEPRLFVGCAVVCCAVHVCVCVCVCVCSAVCRGTAIHQRPACVSAEHTMMDRHKHGKDQVQRETNND